LQQEFARGALDHEKIKRVGKSVMMLIPEDRLDEERTILERIKRGQRVDHYEQPAAWLALFVLLAAGILLGPFALWWSKADK
jgi:hypothetical protein